MRSSQLQPLFSLFRLLAPVSDGALTAFGALIRRHHFAAGAWLLAAGEQAQFCHFITSGLVRELYISPAGEEHTRSFLVEGQVTGSLLDLLSGEPAVTWIQALEPTETLAWRFSDFESLCERFPDLHVVARRSAEALCVRKIRREYEMLALTAAERHARWLRDSPQLDGRIQRRHLASYLGVSAEHLSRLRAVRARRRSPIAG